MGTAMKTPAERLKWARRATAFRSAAECARAIGIPEPTYRAHESNGRKLSEPAARTYGKLLNVRWAWLLTGEGEPTLLTGFSEIDAPQQEAHAQMLAQSPETYFAEQDSAGRDVPAGSGIVGIAMLPKDVRVLGTAIGGNAGDFTLNGETIDYVRRPPSVGDPDLVFAIYLIGESMYPRYEDGDLVYVHTKIPPAIGRDVLVELHGSEKTSEPGPALVKRLVRRTTRKFILQQFNPPRSDIEIDVTQVKHIYRILSSAELLAV